MLDIELIRNQPDQVKKAIVRKGANPELVDDAKRLDKEKRRVQLEVEAFQTNLNRISKEIAGQFGQRKLDLLKEASELSSEIDKHKPDLEKLESELSAIMSRIPNMPLDTVPNGKDESDNKVVREVGKKPTFGFTAKDHVELSEQLGLLDTARAAKVSGTRFTYMTGKLVNLQFALIQHALNVLSDQSILSEIITKNHFNVPNHVFTPVVPPVFIKPEVFEKMARLEPKEERYYIPTDDLYLAGSAEHTLGPLHMDETIPESEMPLRYVGYSTSFRREAGSYGKDTKGILRLHQFDKLEIESFTLPEHSLNEQNFIVAIQEYLMQSLGLTYQVVEVCTGDMGDPDARQVDINTWMPGQNKYRETHTSDMMTDYQARRLKTRVKRSSGATEYVHMNDATVFAIGRTLIAIMENYQQKDGSIKVPKVLTPYAGFELISK